MRSHQFDGGPIARHLRRHRRALDFTIFGIAIINMAIFAAQLLRVSL